MELIIALFQAYSAVKDVAQASEGISDWVLDKIMWWSKKATTSAIDKQVMSMGGANDAEIRKAAATIFAKSPKSSATEAKREELISLMINMSRNIRYRSAFGSMSGSTFRSEQSLISLVVGLEPVRHANEPVVKGSPWVLKRHLGMGSFGEVWMAQNPDFPLPRAYKFFTNDQSGEWLRREQEGLRPLLKALGGHPHIVKFEDVQSQNCDHPYLAFEYMGGGSLEQWIVSDKDRRPDIDSSEIIRQVVAGLAAAHTQNIAHRDIKPANILLTEGPDVRVKIGDFGLAKLMGTARTHSQLASLTGMVGTILYLPPEAQQRGIQRKSKQDDVFAVGVVWYQLAMGAIERPPYDFAERLRSKGIDSYTIGLIERCLAHPDRRFRDAQELQAALTDNIPPITSFEPGTPDVQYLAREYLSTLSR
ncbi:serine/threonine-protein kinase [Singulisphaera sp. PoT]|uniref:serine/threonine-protein kinase n=1 Tax=Singulisphaera sp. PoT TaxID=3411797 RepID=UPI003BF55DAE